MSKGNKVVFLFIDTYSIAQAATEPLVEANKLLLLGHFWTKIEIYMVNEFRKGRQPVLQTSRSCISYKKWRFQGNRTFLPPPYWENTAIVFIHCPQLRVAVTSYSHVSAHNCITFFNFPSDITTIMEY